MPRGRGVRSVDNTPEIAPMARQGDVANMNVHDTLPAADGDRTRSALIEAAAAVARRAQPRYPAAISSPSCSGARRRRTSCATGRKNSRASPSSPGRCSQERKPGAPKIRFEPARGEAERRGARDRQRRHAVPGRFGDGRAHRTRARHPPGGASDLHGRARRETGKLNAFREARDKGDGRAKASSTSMSSASTMRRRAPRSCARSQQVLADVRVCVQDWRPMLARAERGHRRAAGPIRRRCRSTRSPRRSQFLEWIAADNFTLLGVRDYAYTDSEHALEPQFETGLGMLRRRDVRVLRRGDQLVIDHAGDPRVPQRAEAADHHQGARALARAPPRLSRLHRRQALRPRRQAGRRIPLRRAVHLDRLHALDALDSLSAAQGRQRHRAAPASIRTAIPARRWSTCWRHYPRDELFQIDEDTLYQFALAILQLDERPRVRVLARRDRFDRFVSVLVYVPRERYDSQVRGADRRLSRRASSTAASAPSIRSFRKAAGARAFHHRPRRGRDAESRSRQRSSSAVERDRAHLDRRARRCARRRRTSRGRRARCSARYRDAFSDRLSRGLSAGDRGRRHPRDRGADRRTARSASISTATPGRSDPAPA